MTTTTTQTPSNVATPAEIEQARQRYQQYGGIEIDEEAIASRGDDDGCYIAAWVWIDSEKGEDADDDQEEDTP